MTPELKALYQEAAEALDTGELGKTLRLDNNVAGRFQEFSVYRKIFDKEIDKIISDYRKRGGRARDFDREILWNQIINELRYYGPQPMIF